MSFLKKLLGEGPGDPSAAPQLPEKKISAIFPYLKYSENSDNAINDVFMIDDETPKIGTSYFNAQDGKEQKMEIIFRKILPDCLLFYGFDLGPIFMQVMPNDFNESLRLDNIHQAAKENLTYFLEHEKKPQVRSSENGINVILCGGDYESALILFPNTWTHMQQQLGGPIYIAIPARNMILFAAKDNLAAIDQIKQYLKEHYRTYDRPLSKYLYKVEAEIWTVAEKIIE